MTTDPFTDAAHAEAKRLYPNDGIDILESRGLDGFAIGVIWARAHLAAQEPTEAEVRAVKIALIQYEYRVVPGNELTMIRHLGREDEYDKRARAALSAARDARRDEEKR